MNKQYLGSGVNAEIENTVIKLTVDSTPPNTIYLDLPSYKKLKEFARYKHFDITEEKQSA